MSKERLKRIKGFEKTVDNYYSEGNELLATQALKHLYQENHIDWLIE